MDPTDPRAKNAAWEDFLCAVEDKATDPDNPSNQVVSLLRDAASMREGKQVFYKEWLDAMLLMACQRRRMTWEESDDLRGRAFFDYVSMR